MKQNLVAHYVGGTSDKVYLACVRIIGESGGILYKVIGKWGRRGRGNLQQMVRLTTRDEAVAVAEQKSLFASKLKEGYVDIESPAYNGPVHLVSNEILNNLEQYNQKPPPGVSPPPAPVVTTPVAAVGEEIIVECISNMGIEDKFDAGIEYVGLRHKDPTMIWVFDKCGVKQDCYLERFKEVAGI
jgi:predicted DNA-binding WGR domain protein